MEYTAGDSNGKMQMVPNPSFETLPDPSHSITRCYGAHSGLTPAVSFVRELVTDWLHSVCSSLFTIQLPVIGSLWGVDGHSWSEVTGSAA